MKMIGFLKYLSYLYGNNFICLILFLFTNKATFKILFLKLV